MNCDYCLNFVELVTGETIYPHRPELWGRAFYFCRPCGAWVGCHRGTTSPMGRLANKELRQAKMQAHAAFDPIWRGTTSRGKAYRWLANKLGIDSHKCHIGMFDVEECRRVVELSETFKAVAHKLNLERR